MSQVNKFNINDIVTFNLAQDKIRWCTVLSFKIDQDSVRYDLLKQGIRLYDVLEHYLETPSEHIELTPM